LKLILFFLAVILVGMGGLYAWSRAQVLAIEDSYPPAGSFVGREGERTHFVDMHPGTGTDIPVILFVHGASGNLNDQRTPFAPALEGKARLIFVDRPGHGYSQRAGAETPAQHAERYAQLLDELGIKTVTVVGHSLGAASAAAFAVNYPDRVKGLVLVAPATHPWPTGVAWYYKLAALPVIGRLFTETLVLPIGLQSLASASQSVFKPQSVPVDYLEHASIAMVLRPKIFRNNARDVVGLNDFVTVFSKRYQEIVAPTVIITGDTDDVVSPAIHSIGLERDVVGSELIILSGVGHKPEYVATQTVVDAILKVSR
jgi:pimeloyl-ACP methyl ester carboxylesterase